MLDNHDIALGRHRPELVAGVREEPGEVVCHERHDGFTVEVIRPTYHFDVSCQGSVPQSIIAFLDSDCYEGAVRNAISLGGDADTMACIAGAIAEAFYGGTPDAIAEAALERLPNGLRDITIEFMAQYV